MLRLLALLFCCTLLAQSAPTSTINEDCEFDCGDGKCVNLESQCDGVYDCDDKRDEANCDYMHKCPAGQFMCRSSECLDSSAKCNGIRDCSDNSDEKYCKALPVYTNLPSQRDFEHAEMHVEMTATMAPRVTRRFKCEPSNFTLYYTNEQNAIYMSRNSGEQYRTRLIMNRVEASGAIRTLSVDYPNKELIYVADRTQAQIHLLNEDHADRLLLEDKQHRFSTVAKDWVTGNLYYTEDGLGIGVCIENKRLIDDQELACMMLLNETSMTEGGHKYRSLILHPKRGIMFWIQDEPAGVLKVGGMDGERVRTLSGFEHVHAIAFDYEQERLYVAEGDGVDVIDVLSMQRVHYANIKPAALAVHGCDLFYVERDQTQLKKYVDGGHKDEYVASLTGYRFLLAMVGDNGTRGHEAISDPCDEAECSEFCVLTESAIEPSARCVCVICERIEDEITQGALSWLIAAVLVIIMLFFFCVFVVVYLRLSPMLNSHIDELLGSDKSNDSANISVGYNNSAFKANQELANQDDTN